MGASISNDHNENEMSVINSMWDSQWYGSTKNVNSEKTNDTTNQKFDNEKYDSIIKHMDALWEEENILSIDVIEDITTKISNTMETITNWCINKIHSATNNNTNPTQNAEGYHRRCWRRRQQWPTHTFKAAVLQQVSQVYIYRT